MSVRQYIGARYIPIFADPIQWDSTSSYEPLTVVMNLGTSYVSKQSVPVGIDIENEDYWIAWADYNAQIEAYRAEVAQYNGRISAIEGALPISDFDSTNTVDARLDDIDSEITTIKGNGWVTTARLNDDSVTTAKIADANVTTAKIADANVTTAKIADANVTTAKLADDSVTSAKIADNTIVRTNLDNDLYKELSENENIKNECWLLLGDSYGQGTAVNQDGTNDINKGWVAKLVGLLGLTDYYKYFGGSAGFLTTSTSTSGSSSTVPTDTTYGQILNYAYSYINGLGRAGDVKHIVIQGGWNDSNYSGSLTQAGLMQEVSTVISNLRSNFPNAKIYIMASFIGSTQKTSTQTKSLVSRAYRNACSFGGAAFGETANLPWLYQTISHDTVHPNEDGQRILAGMIINLVKYGFVYDYEGVSADGFCKITCDHKFSYGAHVGNSNANPFSSLTIGADNEIIAANWSRTAESNINFDIPVWFHNNTTNADGIATIRYYNTGRMRLLNPQGTTISVGNSVTLTPIFEVPFH